MLLFLLWSSLYSQQKLSEQFHLDSSDSIQDEMMVYYDSVLIQRLNNLVYASDSHSLDKIIDLAAIQYKSSGIEFPTKVKSSLFGNGLAYFGIEGYFNPFTGEAQINPELPNFMLPFVVMHEMAHQIGIAAEDDANLMAYIRCIESKNEFFKYSAYFNLWLYAHRKVNKIDSVKANILKANLNSSSLAHLRVLKERNRQFHTFLDDWSTYLFDSFLKLGNQEAGIESYRNVAFTALLWERKQFPYQWPSK
jgi:hypothetical protein